MITKGKIITSWLSLVLASSALAQSQVKPCPDDDPLGLFSGNEGCQLIKPTLHEDKGTYTLHISQNGSILRLNTKTGELVVFNEEDMSIRAFSNDLVQIKVGHIYEFADAQLDNKYQRYQGAGKFEAVSILEMADKIIRVDY